MWRIKKNCVVQNVCNKWHKMGVLLYDDDFQKRVCDTFLICVIVEGIINHHITFKVRHLKTFCHITHYLHLDCSLSGLIRILEFICKSDKFTTGRFAEIVFKWFLRQVDCLKIKKNVDKSLTIFGKISCFWIKLSWHMASLFYSN